MDKTNHTPTPPRWAQWLLARWGHPDTLEEVQGDLLEFYAHWARTRGEREARRRYGLTVLKLLRPFAKRNQDQAYPSPSFLHPAMIRNYFTIARRNLLRHPAFSVLNLSGLSLGLACSLLILLWAQDERGVDEFHANAAYLYQVYERGYYDGKVEAGYGTQGLLADELKRVVPDVQYASGLDEVREYTLATGDKIAKAQGSFAGADFFNMFSYPLLAGTPQTALRAPNGVAISRKMAELFFGDPAGALGKTIRYENKTNLTVTAVFENLPARSSQQFDFLRTWGDFVNENAWLRNWGDTSPLTFVQLRAGRDPARVEAKIKDFIYGYMPREKGFRVELGLQRYADKYLHSNFENGKPGGGRIGYVRLFCLVAVFILLIACINFTNLTTARATKRAKEVGIRKVVGATRGALAGQFVGEALLLTFLAGGIALLLVLLVLPAFNAFTGKHLGLPLGQPLFWAGLAGLFLGTGLVAGAYPALLLASLRPILIMRGNGGRVVAGGASFRQGLVVFQFALSVVLIVGTLVVYRQMQYVQTKNLGYSRENLLIIPIEGELLDKYAAFKQEAARVPGVLSVSKARHAPTTIDHQTGSIGWPGKDPNLIVSFTDAVVGYDFVKTLGLQLSRGRDFSPAYGTDAAGFLVNEAAVRRIGYRDPVGQPLQWGDRQGRIIGVLKDFHFASLHQSITPLIVRLDDNFNWGVILVRLDAHRTREALAGLEGVSKAINPAFPFTFRFSDQEYEKLYRSESVVASLANAFAFLAILISCLGLLGLSTFTAEQRTKGNRHPQGAGRFGDQRGHAAVEGLSQAGVPGHCRGNPRRLVRNEPVAGGLRLQDGRFVVDFRPGGPAGGGHCPADGKLPEHEGGAEEPGKVAAQRVGLFRKRTVIVPFRTLPLRQHPPKRLFGGCRPGCAGWQGIWADRSQQPKLYP
jgi:hypothetical protein